MLNRTKLLIGAAAASQFIQPFAAQAQNQNNKKPNVIILFTDDQGYGDMGCYGAKNIETPNLDKMASQGTRFTNFYVAASSCTPSRASLLTGCYPQRVGLPNVVDDLSKKGLSSNEHTIADYLKQNGYATAMFGKWHLGHQPEFMPNRHGFTEFFGIPYSNDMWPFHPKPAHEYPPIPLYSNETVLEYNPNINELTTRFTNKSVDFINKHKDDPFMIYLPYSQPHVPVGVSDKFRGKSEQGLYGDAIMEIDWSVGQIIGALDKNGISENTIVLFSSDNGPWLTYGNHAGSTGGLREGKGSTFDGGQKVPFLVRMPGRIPAGKVNDQMLTALDILPTILHITNSSMPKIKPVDGQNVWNNMRGKSKDHKAFFFVKGDEVQAVRDGKWKLHLPHKYRIVLSEGKDGIPGKQDNYGGEIELSLFNVDKDPNETKNLASKYPKVVAQLKTLIADFDTDLKENSRPAGTVI